MSRSATDYLRHILHEAEYLAEHTAGLTRETFLGDETLKRAFVRSLEIIGEASKRLPPEWRDSSSTIDWRAMAGMRDRLIHSCFGIDYEIVWDVVSTKVAILRSEVRTLIDAPGQD